MNKNWAGAIGIVVVALILAWLIGGGSVTCRESFWDKDKQIIEIKRD